MSTIITQNPYTFTVADNMNINAIFEDGAPLIISATANNPTTITLKNYSGDTYTLNLTEGSNNIYDDSISGFSGDDIKTVYYTTSSSAATNTDLTTLDLSGCRNITSFVNYAFQRCSRLTTFTLPPGLTNISINTFKGCEGLTSITFPEGLTNISAWAFQNCEGLTSITFPEGLTNIGNQAFSMSSNLESFTIPSTVVSIGQNAFQFTKWWNNQGAVKYNNNVCLGGYASGDYTIESGTRLIADSAFENQSGLNTFTIPSSVSIIGSNAFKNTGWWSSQPNNSIVYKDNVCFGRKGTVDISSGLTIDSGTRVIAGSAFSGSHSLPSLTLPSGLVSIGDYAFQYCYSLTSLTLPDSITYIGDSAFEGYSGTLSTLPSSLTYIGDYAFSNFSLTSLTLPSGLTYIGSKAFRGIGASSLTLPSSVKNLSIDAFSSSLRTLTLLSANPPVLSGPYNINETISFPSTIYVPAASVDTYKTANVWRMFADSIQAIP